MIERPFQAALLLKMLEGMEKHYKVAVRYRHEVQGAEGIVYDKAYHSKYFQMSFEASFETKDLLARREVVLHEMAVETTNDFLEGLKQAGAKFGDILLVLAYPANPPVVLAPPTIDGTTNVFCKLIVSLPERLPRGLPDGFTFKGR